MNKSPHFSQQIQPKQSGLKLRKYVPIHQKTDLITEVKVYLKIIITGFHARETPTNKAAVSGNSQIREFHKPINFYF